MNEGKPAAKRQMLVEDAQALELNDGTIRKTLDREAEAAHLRENAKGPQPAHPVREDTK